MKIRKSRLKQIIKEEVSSFKFIPINEGVDPEVEKQVLSDAINSLQALANAVDTHNDLGLENDANGILASVIENLQSLMNPVSEDNGPSTLLDEIVVQEIVKALAEDTKTPHSDQAETAKNLNTYDKESTILQRLKAAVKAGEPGAAAKLAAFEEEEAKA